MSHFADYILERQGKSIIEDENGFATYFYVNDSCYIEDIYVVPTARRSRLAGKYVDKIAEEAKSKGYTKIMGSINLNANGATESMKGFMFYGFKLSSAQNNAIFLIKDI